MTVRCLAGAAALAGSLLVTVAARPVAAQPLGTFRWQLQPFCNVLTVRVDAVGGVFRLDGFDDQCGAPERAPAVGVATLNPDGSIGVGLHIVTAPEGRPVSLDARVNPGDGQGTWRDSAGNSGRFALGLAAGGSPRPAPTVPASMIAAGAIGAQHLAPGLIGGVAQSRVTGLCTNTQAMRGVNADGTVACTNAMTTVKEPGNIAGIEPAMAVASDGRPIISHFDATAKRLALTYCGDSACVSGNRTTTMGSTQGGAGRNSSIAIGTDGVVIIAHHDTTAGALALTHCGDAVCRSDTTTLEAKAAGEFASIAIGRDGLPIVSHYDRNRRSVAVTHCGDVACRTGNVTRWPDPSANDVGLYTSIAIGADGLPVVSYHDATASALRVTHCGDVACAANNVSTTVDDPAGPVGVFSSIAIGADGLAIIAHYEEKAGLRVTHCGNAACTAGNVSTPVTRPFDRLGYSPSIAIGADGLALISHQNLAVDGALAVTHCANAACTTARTARVDTLDVPHAFDSSMVIGADRLPIVAHYAKSLGALRVTKCGTVTCQ